MYRSGTNSGRIFVIISLVYLFARSLDFHPKLCLLRSPLASSVMNFSAIIALCLLGGAAIVAPTASAASIDTYPNFFSSDQIKHFASVDVDGEGAEEVFNKAFGVAGPGVPGRGETVNRSVGAAALDPAISRQLLDVTGTQMTAEELRSIPITKITGTTQKHVDCHYHSGERAVDKVAFVFLDSNPEATFVHGSTEIPVEAGKLVVFDGNVPHNTRVARGTVALAGPIDLRRLSVVWVLGSGPSPKSVKGPKSPKSPKSPKAAKGGSPTNGGSF